MQYLCRKRQKQDMNQLDLFLGFVVLFFALGGLFGGAVRRVIQIAALIIAFREAWRLAPWVESVLGGGDGQSISGWGFIFALVYIGIRLMGNWFSSLTKGTFLSVIDRIKWGGGAAYRHRSPHTFPQAPAEEHRLTQRSNNLLYSKIVPSRGLTKKPLTRGAKTNQYWSPIGAVLVAPSTSTGYYHGPVLVTSATSTG